jgi:ClpP class serine protease
MAEELDALLEVGVLILGIVAVALNALTSLYAIRHLQPIQPTTPKGEESEGEDEDEDEDEDGGEGEEDEDAGVPTKEEILARRAQLIRELEEERGTRVLQLIHRKEPWSSSDEDPQIVLEDSELILQQIRETPPDKPIDFIVHTEGGLTVAADLIAMALRYHKAKITVMVPFYAMSDGTYLVLAADEIMMERTSTLAPLEPLIDDMPANWVMGILKRKPIEAISDRTVLFTETARMETENARELVKWLLADKMGEEQASQVANFLVGGYMAANTPITLDVARAIGLNVVEGVPDKVMQLFDTIEFGGGKVPGRQYQ